MFLDPIRLKLLKTIEKRETDLKNTSIAIGKNPAYLHQFLYRGTPKVLPEDARQALAAHLAVEEDDLRHEQSPPRKRPTASAEIEKPPPLRGRRKIEGYLPVTEVDVRASAGHGAVHDGLEEAKNVWLFPEDVVRHEFRARADDLRIVTIDGDSMEPLLSTGDRILVDTAQRIPVPPGIFVIWDGMGLVAKRVEHVPNSEPPTIAIRSVNPEYPNYERQAEEVNIVGRVVWAAKRL